MLPLRNRQCHVVSFNYGPFLKYLSCEKAGTQKACDRLAHMFKGLSLFLIGDPQNACPLQFRSLRKGLLFKRGRLTVGLSELHNWGCVTQVPSTSYICEFKFMETHSNTVKFSNNGSGYQLLQHKRIYLFLGLGTTHGYKNTKSPEKKLVVL